MASPAAQLRASAEAKSRQSAVRASATRNRSVTVVKGQDSFTRESSTLLPQRVQAAMRVSSPNDPAEREATAVARNVVQMPVSSSGARPKAGAPHTVSRMQSTLLLPAVVQREGKGAAQPGPEVATEIRAGLGGGEPLTQAVRDFMEPRFRADFGRVRIHTNNRAAGLAARLSARAFAYGQDIFFGKDEYRPESAGGRELIAHELTHTIQQRSAAPAKASREVDVTERSSPQVQRLGFDTARNYFADKANALPGFRMLTVVLGKNPINDTAVDRSPGNVFRAIVEFIPGASLVTDALNNAGIFDKFANWAWGQIQPVASAFMDLGGAVLRFLKSLGARDLLSPGAAIDRGIGLVTGPINQIKSLVAGFIDAVLEFVKEAILRPLGKLAEGTDSYDLLKGVMGEDPVTGDAVDNSAELMVGGFMKIIGQDEVWQNIQKSGALAKCWAWMQGALADLKAFVAQIPGLFMAGLKSLTLIDIIVVPLAYVKLAKVFGSFLGRFISWAGEAMWNLLEIVFKAVKPDAWEYIQKTGAALKSILQNPLPFLGNLIAAGKGGFSAFGGNFLTHLKKGLIDWLTGSLDGVYIPKALTLGEIVKFVFSVLGLTYARFRVKMVKAFGEPAVLAMEAGFRIVSKLVNEGPASAWEQVKTELDELKDQVVEGIKGLVIEAVITKGIPKLIAMFIPGAGFIGAIISIYDTVMVIVNQIAKIIAVVKSFVDSIVAIANGDIGAAVKKVESVLATGLSLAINFFAAFAGLGKISAKINGVIQKIRAPVDKAMDSLIGWVKKMAKSFIDKVAGKDATPEEKLKRVKKAAAAGAAAVNKWSGKFIGEAILKPLLSGMAFIYKVSKLEPVKQGKKWAVRAEINPIDVVQTQAGADPKASVVIDYEQHWPLDEFNSKAGAIKRASERKKVNVAKTLGDDAAGNQLSTKPLRKGGQERFRGAIHSYIDKVEKIPEVPAANSARGLMTKLQADHQQELQMGGTDRARNMAMTDAVMNREMGTKFRSGLMKLDSESVLDPVTVKTGAAVPGQHTTTGNAVKLQTLLEPFASKVGTAVATVRNWFKLG
jgi:hypothetical protein